MKNYIVPEALYENVLKALSKAEKVGAFKNCVLPNFGQKTIHALNVLKIVQDLNEKFFSTKKWRIVGTTKGEKCPWTD